ncbi:Z-ring formation inhibitor MciZ [Paenibacillus athensensis]|uniref:Z-ring formation inhibitor MciZ n=1 Tax=Paenibacillus athensensis TaxID=1967502 RepID=A0A4Y8Q1D9_9BACL|nr:Z-ring formation inhibitor MciZ [Paenibacillus athensensis]MCD1260720.1 Z-ring formation inhibitor MciZ [Paenibacillus athensensis]
MKSYWSDHQLRIVGKAWEIRRYLQLMLQNGGAETRLADYLESGRTPLTRSADIPDGRERSARLIPFPGGRL